VHRGLTLWVVLGWRVFRTRGLTSTAESLENFAPWTRPEAGRKDYARMLDKDSPPTVTAHSCSPRPRCNFNEAKAGKVLASIGRLAVGLEATAAEALTPPLEGTTVTGGCSSAIAGRMSEDGTASKEPTRRFSFNGCKTSRFHQA